VVEIFLEELPDEPFRNGSSSKEIIWECWPRDQRNGDKATGRKGMKTVASSAEMESIADEAALKKR
jgi:hypothetical protein